MATASRRSLFFEDFEVGAAFETHGRTVGEADVTQFAGLTGDHTPIHVDSEYAKGTLYGARVAHGLLGLSLATGLVTQLGILEESAMGLLEIECRFTSPIHLGDTVRARQTVTEKRETSKPDRGIVGFRFELVNQKGETVLTGAKKIMVRRRG